MGPSYSGTQEQCLVFIYYDQAKIHAVPPSEADMQGYVNASAPAVHNMIVTLEKRGLIRRFPHAARSIQTLLTRDSLPGLN